MICELTGRPPRYCDTSDARNLRTHYTSKGCRCKAATRAIMDYQRERKGQYLCPWCASEYTSHGSGVCRTCRAKEGIA